jgi:hypothetical protein
MRHLDLNGVDSLYMKGKWMRARLELYNGGADSSFGRKSKLGFGLHPELCIEPDG